MLLVFILNHLRCTVPFWKIEITERGISGKCDDLRSKNRRISYLCCSVVICVVLLLFVLFCCYLCCSVVICVVLLSFVLFCCYLCCSVVICVVLLLFVLFCCYLCLYAVCVWMCTVLLPPGVNPIVVNKYIISYHISYHILSYHITSYHIIPQPTALLSPRSNGKTRGCYYSCWAPDDGRDDARYMLRCTYALSNKLEKLLHSVGWFIWIVLI
jgi:hypothetical protein